MGRSYLSIKLALVFGVVVGSLAAGVERVRDGRAVVHREPASVEAEWYVDRCGGAGVTKLAPVALVVTGDVLDVLQVWGEPIDGTRSRSHVCERGAAERLDARRAVC
jgi:hypothetical protein